jgi:hypothetical protein
MPKRYVGKIAIRDPYGMIVDRAIVTSKDGKGFTSKKLAMEFTQIKKHQLLYRKKHPVGSVAMYSIDRVE